ncbi:MAG: WD40 repeat domain-containing protein [Chloroflexi bacterium]|nr:WD40 repeat domain-containing protein [Chloroflexota bacterium]
MMLIVLGIISLGILAQNPAAAQLQANIRSMEWSADGSRFALITGLSLSIYDQSLNQIAYQAFPTNIEFEVPDISLSPDGTRIFVGNNTEKRILDTTTLSPVVDFQNASISPGSAQWNGDGSEIALRRGDGRGTDIYDASTGKLLKSFSAPPWGYGFFNLRAMPMWSPNDAYFAGVIGGDIVVILNAMSGKEVTRYQIGSEQIIHEIAWSPDQTNPRLALVTWADVEPGSPGSVTDQYDSTEARRYSLIVVDALSGTVLSSTTGLPDLVWRLAWSPDGLQLAGKYGSGSPYIHIWDPNTGERIDSYLPSLLMLQTLQYSPYGGRLLIAYNNRFESQQRYDEFVPIAPFAQTELDELVQFVAPAASPERIQSILSSCTADPDTVAAGNRFLASDQYDEFIQWLGQQAESAIPALCADDLQFMAEVISHTRPPNAAGLNQVISYADAFGTVPVTLDGSGSFDADGTIVAYSWTDDTGTEIATTPTSTVDLPSGIHTFTLTVTDNDGLTASDRVVITVRFAPIHSMDWSADGSRFAVTTLLGLSIYDRSLNQIAYQAFPDNPDQSEYTIPSIGIALSPDGTRIFVGNGTENRILDTTTLAPVVDFQNASIRSDTSQWNSDGSEIAFRRGDDRGTEIYDATTGNLLRSFSIDSWRNPFSNPESCYPGWNIGNERIIDIIFSPDKTSPRLAASTHEQVELGSPDSFLYPFYGYPFQNDPLIAWRNTVRVIDAPRGTTLASITGLRDLILQLVWSPDGMELAGVDRYRRLYIWNPNTGDLIDSYLTAPFQVKSLEYSPYGGRLLIVYNALEGSQERPDEFIPISTFAQIEFDGLVQFVAPAASPEKTQSILSQCATDPDIAATGNSFLASGQYAEFIQWLGQQDESVIPPSVRTIFN